MAAIAISESEQCQEQLKLLEGADSNSLLGYESTAAPVIPRSQSADIQESIAIEASTTLKLKCVIYALFLIGLGFIATIVETQAFSSRLSDKKSRYPTEWVCFAIKIGFLIPAIGSLLYLQNNVIVPGKIRKVRLVLSNKQQASPQANVAILKDVDCCVQLPSNLSDSPSKLFLATSLLFSCFSCLSIIIEMACDVIEATQGGESLATDISELLRRFLLLVFIAIQTRFFLLNNRVCIQWKLTGVWIAASHILATNVSAWFINVGFEMIHAIYEIYERKVINATKNKFANHRFCEVKPINSIAKGLYPFLIEYYVMSALLAYALLSNTGRLSGAIRRASDAASVTSDYIMGLLNPEPHDRYKSRNTQADYLMLRTFSCTICFGIGLVLVALAVSVFVRSQGRDKPEAQITFYCTLLLLYTCGIVYTTRILRALKSDEAGTQKLSGGHLTDRILLWIGAAAITWNGIYTFWSCCTFSIYNNGKDALPTVSIALMAASSLLNICQSLMQVYVLECALVRNTEVTMPRGLFGQAQLSFLILLNAAQWLIETVCFNFFFPKKQLIDGVALSLLVIPLQVFFRFHSIACIHDFRRHCRDNTLRPSVRYRTPESCVEIDFPVMPQQRELQGGNLHH